METGLEAKLKQMKKRWLAVVVSVGLLPATALGSDHADPVVLKTVDSGLTGLFAFPDGDRMILILGAHRDLHKSAPYDLESFEFTIHLDLHSQVAYNNPAAVARYGGRVVDPRGISADASIRIRLNDDASLNTIDYEGLSLESEILVRTGVFDDPFIFPAFFKRNIIGMVVSIPTAAFPSGREDFVLWATSSKTRSGKQIDHVGRSNRTQQGRFDFLNKLHPSEHVEAIHKRADARGGVMKALMNIVPPLSGLFEYVFQIRPYDLQPDVMIYTTREVLGLNGELQVGYPNGRRLTDDVAKLTCRMGDCILWELSFAMDGTWPRVDVNDAPFRSEFPFLAAQWPDEPKAQRSGWLVLIVVLLVLSALAIVLRWNQKRAALAAIPEV